MEIHDYCKNMDRELSQWEGKLHNVVFQMDSMPTSAKQGMYEEVNGLHIVVTELADRIKQLRTECSVAWKVESDGAVPTISGSSQRFNDAAGIHFDYDFGG